MHGRNRLGQMKTAQRRHCRRAVSVLFTVIFIAATAAGCSRSSTDTVPDSLLGVWTTPDPRYAGRFLDLRPHSVTFGLGEDGQSVYPVSYVEWTSERGESVFTVHYEAEDGSDIPLPQEEAVRYLLKATGPSFQSAA
jgi:hypothetical protein